MGTLIAMRHRLALTAKLADHTYVICGDGTRAWGCWGDDDGGTPLRAGRGSTCRADAIAGRQAHAGIRCYLVNGVCHQAANRVLLPAGLTVRGAEGYDVSEALFGTYGRPRGLGGLCHAPFFRHAEVAGDLDPRPDPRAVPALPRRRPGALATERSARRRERRYLAAVQALYRRAAEPAGRALRAPGPGAVEDFQLELFRVKVAFQLPAQTHARLSSHLASIRRAFERSRLGLEDAFLHGELTAREFADRFNVESRIFQDAAAGVLIRRDYRALFGRAPGDALVLADPAVVERAFRHHLERPQLER